MRAAVLVVTFAVALEAGEQAWRERREERRGV